MLTLFSQEQKPYKACQLGGRREKGRLMGGYPALYSTPVSKHSFMDMTVFYYEGKKMSHGRRGCSSYQWKSDAC